MNTSPQVSREDTEESKQNDHKESSVMIGESGTASAASLRRSMDEQRNKEEWTRELARRAKTQQLNLEYIDTNLTEPMQKIMVATLNKMPEEPAQFMKDYISLHYFFERKQEVVELSDDEIVDRVGLRFQDLEDLKEEVKSLEREKYRFSNLKKAFVSFTKQMNYISNSGMEIAREEGLICKDMERSIGGGCGVEVSDESASEVNPAIFTRQQQLQMHATPELNESSEEVLQEPSLEEVKVIVSPKSSMISSRLAEPATAELMASKLIDFWQKNETNIELGVQKQNLVNLKSWWSLGPQNNAMREIDERQSAAILNQRKQYLRMPTKQERNDVEMKLSSINSQLISTWWINDLNEFMEHLSEFLCATASINNFGSVSSQIAVALANSIQTIPKIDELSNCDITSNEDMSLAGGSNNIINQQNEYRHIQEAFLTNIKIIKVKQGPILYSLENTFNVVISGRVQNNKSQTSYKRFDVIADYPLQTNLVDQSKPISVLSTQQKIDTLSGLEVKGIETSNCLRLTACEPNTYLLQINFNKPSASKMPLERCCNVLQNLEKDLIHAMNIKETQFDSQRCLTNRITYMCEVILARNERLELEDECIYCVFAGKLVLGKMIIQEKQFIVGKAGRQVMALVTTSLIKLIVMSQRV